MILLNKRTPFVILFVAMTYLVFGQGSLLDYDNTLKFARFLRSSGQYGFSIEEYERLNYMKPGDSVASIEFIQTCRTAGQCEKLNSFFTGYKKTNLLNKKDEFATEYLRASLYCKTIPEDYFQVSSLFGKEEKAFYELSSYWVSRNYRGATKYCIDNAGNLMHKSPDLYQLTIALNGEKKKSPALAGLMSAIVPGSGKAYSGRWGDALVSLLFVGTNAFISYRGFHKKGIKSFNGWFFGGVAFSFYSAGIWGSAKAAKNYNQLIKDNYQKNAEGIIYSHF